MAKGEIVCLIRIKTAVYGLWSETQSYLKCLTLKPKSWDCIVDRERLILTFHVLWFYSNNAHIWTIFNQEVNKCSK